MKIKSVLENGLDFAPIQRKIKKPELRKDFEEFYWCMRTIWNLRNEPSQDFSETTIRWKPPLEHPNLKVNFLRRTKIVCFILIFLKSNGG